MDHAAPRVEMTRDERIRWVIEEEQNLLGLLPVNNGQAVLANEGIRFVHQMDVKFIERIQTWMEYASEVGIDPVTVLTRFEYNTALYTADVVRRLNKMADILEKAPATKMDYQDLILVSTNRLRWTFGIGRPESSTQPIPIVRPPKPPTEPPDPVGSPVKR